VLASSTTNRLVVAHVVLVGTNGLLAVHCVGRERLLGRSDRSPHELRTLESWYLGEYSYFHCWRARKDALNADQVPSGVRVR